MSRSVAVLLVALGLIAVLAIGLVLLARRRKRAAGRGAGRSSPGSTDGASEGKDEDEDDEDAARPPAPFLHSRHWAVLASEEDPRRFLLGIFERLLTPGSGAGAVVRGDLCHLVDRRGRLMFSALIRKGEAL